MTSTDPRASEPTTANSAAIATEKERFGGIKIGAAFFGWLTTVGMTLILTAIVAAIAGGIGLVSSASDVVDAAASQGVSAENIGWAGVVLVLAVIFVSYYSGGYVAGRMARFSGAKQGIGVFAWAVVAAIVIGVLGAIGGAQADVLSNLNLPSLPASTSEISLGVLVSLLVVIAVSIVGAVLGGLAGMHYHRKIDKAGLAR